MRNTALEDAVTHSFDPFGNLVSCPPVPEFLLFNLQNHFVSLVGCRLWGRTELDTTEATQQTYLEDLLILFV